MALYFDGSSSYAKINSCPFTGLTNFTIELVMSTTENKSSGRYLNPVIIGHDIGGYGTGELSLRTSSGTISFVSGLASGDFCVDFTSQTINDGKIHRSE